MPQIGPYKLANPVALAPMAGVTDLPFRRLCAEMGAGLVVSEMISSNPRLRDSRKIILSPTHENGHDGGREVKRASPSACKNLAFSADPQTLSRFLPNLRE